MSFWLREAAGWILILIGLTMFYEVYALLAGQHIWEGGLFTIPAIFVFRGGIHLLKVAVAARVCWQAQRQLYPSAPATAANRGPETFREQYLASRRS